MNLEYRVRRIKKTKKQEQGQEQEPSLACPKKGKSKNRPRLARPRLALRIVHYQHLINSPPPFGF